MKGTRKLPNVTYRDSDGAQTTITVAAGKRIMQTALQNNIDGIIGECGGQAMCATCHVYVEEPWDAKLPPRSEEEDIMLEDVSCERQENSRLSCQIPVTEDLDGITVIVPESQE